MKLLKTIDPDTMATNNREGWLERRAARAIVFDDAGCIALLHVSTKNYYKLPGGGIEDGESMESALRRECEEELGVNIEIMQEVGEIIQYNSKTKFYQESFCYVAKLASIKGTPKFTEEEQVDGFGIVWTSPQKALSLLDDNSVADYEGGFIVKRDHCFLTEGMKLIAK